MGNDATLCETLDRILRRKAVLQIVPVGRTTLWRWIRAGKFPAPEDFNGVQGWRASKLQEWMREER